MPLKTLFGDHAALTEYVERTTDEMLIEFISVTGAGRGTGVVGAAPDAPATEDTAVEENVVEE
eukprot:9997003-Prorocentrum_lima.AAC.1